MQGELRNSGFVERDVQRDLNRQDSEPTLGDLFTSLTSDLTTLVRKEIDLARTETMEKVTGVTRNVVMMVAGGLVAYAGLIALIMAAIFLLNQALSLWVSALIVGIVVIIIGAILLSIGRSSLNNMTVVPEKTVETMKDNTEWAKEQVK
ncbi:MAG: phage holin family protein [Chloroflexi bacterium]|nr:phage holin family protein [Chloroflexota bacterium]